MYESVFKLPALSDVVWGRLRPLIEEELGIKMPVVKKSLLQNRLLRRIKYLGLDSFEEYCDYLFSEEGQLNERTPFFNEVTTNKTFFFREYRHFEVLNDRIIPEFLRKQSARREPLRIWSAACSTGEELYSIACIIEEFMRTEKISFDYEILGTDVSTRVLWHAKSAIYEEEQISVISPDLIKRYFLTSKDKSSNLSRVIPELREKVRLRKVNLMNEAYPFVQQFDVIFCRNVLIYFTRDDILQIVGRCLSHLKTDGYLITGHADSIYGAASDLRRIEPSVFMKKS